MEDFLPDVVLTNPPWVGAPVVRGLDLNAPTNDSCGHTDLNTYTVVNFDACLAEAFRTKLVSLDTSLSVELSRQVLLALHEPVTSGWITLSGFAEESLGPQLYDAYEKPLPRKPLQDVRFVRFCELDDQNLRLSKILPSAYAFEFAQLLFLHVFSLVIDRIADYWNAIAEARLAWLVTSVMFGAVRRRRLGFKPRYSPVRVIPNSIHPIEQAA